MRRALLPVVAALALAGCESAPVPDIAHYRMPAQQRLEPSGTPLIADPIVVEVFLADGVYGEQSVLYQTSPTAPVRAYHYQLWNDPPVRLLQRRLIRRLRNENASPLVADRLPASLSAMRISGLIERFERVQVEPEQWSAAVRLELRVDRGEQTLPLLLESYEVVEPTDGPSIQATIRAFGRAVDTINGRFVEDLRRIAAAPRTG